MNVSDVLSALGLIVAILAAVSASASSRGANAIKIILAENAARLDERVKVLERAAQRAEKCRGNDVA